MSESAEVIRWGVLGTARIATKVGAAIRQADGAELTAIASRDLSKAQAWAGEHGALNSYGSYEELLDDETIDVVYIPLPPALHPEWTIKAARLGKHVLCEKPLAPDAARAEEMADACAGAGVQLMDGVMWVHHPRAAALCAAVTDGRLGDLRRLTTAFTFSAPDMPLTDLRMQRDMGGGALLDLGWYAVGLALRVFGGLPERVWGNATYRNDVDVNFSGMMWFAEDRVASFDCGFGTSMRRWMEVAGTEGSLVCDDYTRPWHEDDVHFWLNDGQGTSEKVTVEPALPIQEVWMVEEMCRIARSGELDPGWPLCGVDVQRVCEALDRSAREGTQIAL